MSNTIIKFMPLLKKFLLLVIAVLAILMVCSCGENKLNNDSIANANPASDFEYTINDNSIIIIKYIGKSETVIIPNMIENKNVTAIGDSAFAMCKSLTNLIIPNSVTVIDTMAVYGCNSLTELTIPDSVTTIGECAFLGCTSLTTVTIPDSVSTIDVGAFMGCSSLTAINVNKNNTMYTDVDGVLFNKSKTKLIAYPNKKSDNYVIPDSVTTINSHAFWSCRSLTDLTIPDSVTYIGDLAFAYCASLKNINIPDSVTYIGSLAFTDCDLLTDEIKMKILQINSQAFVLR